MINININPYKAWFALLMHNIYLNANYFAKYAIKDVQYTKLRPHHLGLSNFAIKRK